MMQPTRRATRYEVCCLPEDHYIADSFTVTVEYRGAGRWAVTNRGRYLDADGQWSYPYGWDREPVTAEEIDAYDRGEAEWKAAHRFDEETALRLADEAAPKVTVAGLTAAQVLAQDAEEAL
jgi:hypothetical protein